jgi:AraC-like DNA-binding protein
MSDIWLNFSDVSLYSFIHQPDGIIISVGFFVSGVLYKFNVSLNRMELNAANTALIIAASQSFLLAALAFQKHRTLFANRFLALLMLGYSIILLHLLFQDTGVYRTLPFLYVIVGVPLAASQLQYLYTKYLLNRSALFSRKDWIHFLPFAVFEVVLVTALIAGASDVAIASTANPENAPFLFQIFNWVLIAIGTAYMAAGYKLILRYNKHLKDVVSSIELVQMNWLKYITLAGISAWILFFVEDLLLTQGINFSNFVFVSVIFAIYVYAMGFVGLTKSEILASPEVERTIHQISEIELSEETTASASKYQKSGLSEETAHQITEKLIALMDREKLYINPTLTLAQLAEKLSVTPHNLSEAINTRLKKNFYDFVNGYRVEQVKKDLTDPSKQHLKILSIAFDAGFNSKAAFNTIFKEQTGMTPSDFRKLRLPHPPQRD